MITPSSKARHLHLPSGERATRVFSWKFSCRGAALYFAELLAPYQSTTTAGSLPTPQVSCPLGREVTSPGSATNSVPSSMRIASRPLRWYWKQSFFASLEIRAGSFAESVPAPAGAEPMTKLVAFLGRTV